MKTVKKILTAMHTYSALALAYYRAGKYHNGYVAMREVPDEVVSAADGMGMSGRQRFLRVELPLALPLVVSGLRLALVQVWATATIAALVAGPGLGRVITDGFFRSNYGKGLAGAVVVALVALVLELFAAAAQRLAQRRAQPTGAGGPGHAGHGRASTAEQVRPVSEDGSTLTHDNATGH